MGKAPVVSLPCADNIIDTVSVDISVLGEVHVAPVVEGLPGVAVEVTVSEGWSDEMHLLVVTDHIFGLWMSGIIPEVGVSGPMSAKSIVTGDIFLAITVDVSP